VIDSVILPPKPANDIASVAKRAGNFKTLLAAVDAAGLTVALTGDKPVTILAPTDAAFAALPKGTVEALLQSENREKLISILSLHAIPGKVSAGDALNVGTATSLNSGTLEFGIIDGVFKVNGATIVKTNIQCDNGIIHVIDAVILSSSKEEGSETASTGGKSPREQIETAIDQGVPVFNDGNHGKCAKIYLDCMVSISRSAGIDPRVSKVLDQLVKRAEGIESDTERAWVLRSGLDHLYAALSES